jgi:hypothetical protein
MPLVILCDHCQRKIGVPENALGKAVRCPLCGAVTQAAAPLAVPILPPAAAVSVVPPRAAAPPAPEYGESPRKRARPRPSASGAIKWIIAAAVGGGVLVAVVAAFAIRALMLGVLGGGGIADSDWKEFTPPAQGFRVVLPGNRRREAKAAGHNVATMYLVERDRGRVFFGVAYIQFTNDELQQLAWEERFESGLQGMCKELPGARVTSRKKITFEGNPGLEVVVDAPGKGTIVSRLYGIGDRETRQRPKRVMPDRHLFVLLSAGGPDFTADAADVRRFLGSFQIVREPVASLFKKLPAARPQDKVDLLLDLIKYGPAAREAVPALIEVVNDTHDSLACAVAANRLRDLGPAAADAIPTLTKVLKSHHPRKDGPDKGQIRLRVAGAMAFIDRGSRFAREVIQDCTRDPEPVVRVWAHAYLIKLDPKAHAADLDEIVRAYQTRAANPSKIKQALVYLGPLASQAVPVLIEALRDPDREIKLSAIESLGAIGPQAREALPELQAVDVPGAAYLRQMALLACWKIESTGGS